MQFKIEINIDCAPGTQRPDVYFEHIWKNILGHTEDAPESVSKFFGNWKWIDIEVTEEQQSEIGKYLKDCYSKGLIRYADW